MQRRTFLGTAASAGLVTSIAPATMATPEPRPSGDAFTLKYAPHFGMFRRLSGDDPVAQLEFMADEGFEALEDNGMKSRSVEDQKKIASTMSRLGMEMGVFVAHADFGKVTMASNDKGARDAAIQQVRDSLEVAKRVNAKWCTVVPGRLEPRMDWGYQTANVIDSLKRCCEFCEPAGLTMVLEPLNPRDHPGLFLTKIAQAYQICRAVDSPSCKILNDLYHQQITEGNLIPNIDASWSETGYFQVGDNPGRREPTTGEINYANVFRHIRKKGFTGIVGMEHGNSRGGPEGDRAVIDAYRAVDPVSDA